jgi:hypothetical protein
MLAISMYVLKTANANRNHASALVMFAAVRLAANQPLPDFGRISQGSRSYA